MSRLLAVLSLLLLSGCYLEERRMQDVPDNGSASWRFGYADGCQSGRHDADSVKQAERDTARFRADDDYRQGWQQGYRECLEREKGSAYREPTPSTAAEAKAEPAPPPISPPAPAAAAAVAAPAAPPPSTAPVPAAPIAAADKPATARRAQIEARIRQLRGEIQSLEAELATLPQ